MSVQASTRPSPSCLLSTIVIAPAKGQRAYLYGQAPGVQEGLERRPWRGRAGQTLRRWLELTEDEFYASFYCASVTRCYPGKAATGRGDRIPTPQEQTLCGFWREWELAILRPALVVCGHIHASGGQTAHIGATPVINAGPDGIKWELVETH